MLKRTCVPGFGTKQKTMEQQAQRLLALPSDNLTEALNQVNKAEALKRAVGQRVQAMRKKCNS